MKKKFWLFTLLLTVISALGLAFLSVNQVQAASYGRAGLQATLKKYRGTWWAKTSDNGLSRIKITKYKLGKYIFYKQKKGYKLPKTKTALRKTRNWQKAYWSRPKDWQYKLFTFENWNGDSNSKYAFNDELIQSWNKRNKKIYIKGMSIMDMRPNKGVYIDLFRTRKLAKTFGQYESSFDYGRFF